MSKPIITIGNLFNSNAQTLVNTVNTVGVMGKGIALEFKKRFPEMFDDYVKRCKTGEVKLRKPYLFKTLLPPWIINFPTKDHWRSVSRLSDLVEGLKYLLKNYKKWGIKSLAVPPLGCGHGQLEWAVVGPTLHRYLSKLEIPVEIYAPYNTPHRELEINYSTDTCKISERNKEKSYNWIQPSWVAVVEILNQIEGEKYHWPIGRTTFQKIVFVSTQAGLPTNLKFTKSSYGPFAQTLKKEITKLINHGLIIEKRLGRMFNICIGPTFSDTKNYYQNQIFQWKHIIESVSDLFARLRTREAEIVATVLFAANDYMKNSSNKPSELDVLESVKMWKQKRRPPLEDSEIALTIRNLSAMEWLDVNPSPELPVPEEITA